MALTQIAPERYRDSATGQVLTLSQALGLYGPAAIPNAGPGPGPTASTMPAPVPSLNLNANDQSARMLALREEILTSLRPMMTGAPGSSPATDAAVEAFKVRTLPIIQNQMALRGLNHSPAVAQVAGDTLAQALPQFITADLQNRLGAVDRASGLIPAENQVYGTQQQTAVAGRDIALREQLDPRRLGLEEELGRGNLGQSGAQLVANIANQEATRGLEGYKTAGQLQLGVGDLNLRAGQLQQEQQRLALQASQGAGGLQRDLSQQVADAFQSERLRLQGLSEGASFGVFGGAALPPSLQSASKTSGSSSK